MIKEKTHMGAFLAYLIKINEGVKKFEIYCPTDWYRKQLYEILNRQDRVIFLSTENGNIIVEQP